MLPEHDARRQALLAAHAQRIGAELDRLAALKLADAAGSSGLTLAKRFEALLNRTGTVRSFRAVHAPSEPRLMLVRCRRGLVADVHRHWIVRFERAGFCREISPGLWEINAEWREKCRRSKMEKVRPEPMT
jgi:hypothetical protein